MPDTNQPAADTEAQAAPVEAEDPTTQTDDGGEPETFTRDYVEKLRQENAKYRTRAKENETKAAEAKKAAERAKMDELQKAQAEKADLEAKLAEERAERVRATRVSELAGKVTNPKRLLMLMEAESTVEDYFTDDGFQLDKALKDYAEFAPKEPGSVELPGARSAKGSGNLKPEDFKGKSPAWIAENLPRLKPS